MLCILLFKFTYFGIAVMLTICYSISNGLVYSSSKYAHDHNFYRCKLLYLHNKMVSELNFFLQYFGLYLMFIYSWTELLYEHLFQQMYIRLNIQCLVHLRLLSKTSSSVPLVCVYIFVTYDTRPFVSQTFAKEKSFGCTKRKWEYPNMTWWITRALPISMKDHILSTSKSGKIIFTSHLMGFLAKMYLSMHIVP